MNLVLSASQHDDLGIPLLPLGQPLAGKGGDKIGDPGVDPLFGHPAHGKEHIVAPDDAGVIQPEHRDRKRKMEKRIVFGVFRVIGHRLDKRGQLFFPYSAGDQGIDQENQDHTALRRRQQIFLEIQRAKGKQDHEKEIDL